MNAYQQKQMLHDNYFNLAYALTNVKPATKLTLPLCTLALSGVSGTEVDDIKLKSGDKVLVVGDIPSCFSAIIFQKNHIERTILYRILNAEGDYELGAFYTHDTPSDITTPQQLHALLMSVLEPNPNWVKIDGKRYAITPTIAAL